MGFNRSSNPAVLSRLAPHWDTRAALTQQNTACMASALIKLLGACLSKHCPSPNRLSTERVEKITEQEALAANSDLRDMQEEPKMLEQCHCLPLYRMD